MTKVRKKPRELGFAPVEHTDEELHRRLRRLEQHAAPFFTISLSEGLAEWRSLALDPGPDAWVFPSEKLTTPVRKDNVWRRHFQPELGKRVSRG